MRRWVKLAVVAFLICVAFNVSQAVIASNDDALNAITEADRTLHDAFMSVIDAERAGANVSDLMHRLAEAGSALTSAEVALHSGNYSDAISQATACKTLADGVAGDAGVLKSQSSTTGWWSNVMYSTISGYIAAVVFVAALLMTWRLFRRFYTKKMLESRPEVTG